MHNLLQYLQTEILQMLEHQLNIDFILPVDQLINMQIGDYLGRLDDLLGQDLQLVHLDLVDGLDFGLLGEECLLHVVFFRLLDFVD
jgi:hypothetical protein